VEIDPYRDAFKALEEREVCFDWQEPHFRTSREYARFSRKEPREPGLRRFNPMRELAARQNG